MFDDLEPGNARLVLQSDHESGSGTIFDLSALQVGPVGAFDAEGDFRVIPEVDHPFGRLDHAAAPAL